MVNLPDFIPEDKAKHSAVGKGGFQDFIPTEGVEKKDEIIEKSTPTISELKIAKKNVMQEYLKSINVEFEETETRKQLFAKIEEAQKALDEKPVEKIA